ncbi:MAG: glycoside hydrolase family 16 protein [Planctomycetes bacterium]|nr:glycoside hydrolase family 16 protein [Planctomycetota bacterium]
MRHALPFLLALAACSACAGRPGGGHPSGWELAWSDEFSLDGRPDPARWGFERGFVRNDELQWYQEDNACVRDGCLVIEARSEDRPHPGFQPGAAGARGRERITVTSASLTTRRIQDFTYGRLEARVRFDPRLGSWPAFWTLGSDLGAVGWPACGEIDILEYFKGHLAANAYWGTSARRGGSSRKTAIAELGGGEWARAFHTYALEWDERELVITVDGRELNRIPLAGADEPGGGNPFRRPQFLIINQAIGGATGGDPAALTYPVRLEVDWVRVYRRRP